MPPSTPLDIGPFRFDPGAAGLFRDGKPVHLTPKAFAVLTELVQRAGQLASKDELLRAVWPDVVVSDACLKVCIREIRKALKDDPAKPRYIDTIHRRGYRFIAATAPPAEALVALPKCDVSLVGRAAELVQLRHWWARALVGERQIVFVTGEPGIGKTTLVEAFCGSLSEECWVARGQCLEQFGDGEAYLPVLEALGRLGRTARGPRLAEVLARHAPTWLQQLPALARRGAAGPDQAAFGANRARMLREFSDAIEVLTTSTPLLLVLEDLHWADRSTLDLISALARRGAGARLLVLATYRPAEASQGNLTAIRQESGLHERCREIRLPLLDAAAVSDLLAHRFGAHDLPQALAKRLRRLSGGNPLFLIHQIDDLVARQMLVHGAGRWTLTVPLRRVGQAIPESVRQLIARQAERLSRDDQRLLQAAAVAGAEFNSALVAHLLGEPPEMVEASCARLARDEHFLKPFGAAVAADHSISARYGFIHALYSDVLQSRLPAAQRARLHRQAGQFLAGQGAGAAELAAHFELGHDYVNALAQLRLAADAASRRHASPETIRHLTRGLRLARRLPAEEQAAARLTLHEQRGLARATASQFADALADFEAMLALTRQLGRRRDESLALFNIARMCFFVDRRRCLKVAKQSLALSHRLTDPQLKADVRFNCSHWRLSLEGYHPRHAQAYAASIAVTRRTGDRERLGVYLTLDALLKCCQGRYRAACATADNAAVLTQKTGDAFHYLCGQFFKCWAHFHLGEFTEVRDVLRPGLQLAEKVDNPIAAAGFQLMSAWMLEMAGDLESARRLCQSVLGTPLVAGMHWFAQIRQSAVELALGLVDEAGQRLLDIRDHLNRDEFLLDWLLRLLFEQQIGEYGLARGDRATVQTAGQQLCALAARSGERTYLALGHDLQARAALLAGDERSAQSAVARALRALRGGDVPMAEWRVCDTAARLRPGSAAAQRYAERGLAIRRSLMGQSVDLRQRHGLTLPSARTAD